MDSVDAFARGLTVTVSPQAGQSRESPVSVARTCQSPSIGLSCQHAGQKRTLFVREARGSERGVAGVGDMHPEIVGEPT